MGRILTGIIGARKRKIADFEDNIDNVSSLL
jgi:hypothetical protein